MTLLGRARMGGRLLPRYPVLALRWVHGVAAVAWLAALVAVPTPGELALGRGWAARVSITARWSA
jgi:hypothetical protein